MWIESPTLSFEAAIRDVHSSNRKHRRNAIIALGFVEDEQKQQAASLLVDVLQDSDAEFRGIAAKALGELRSSSTVQALVAAIGDSDIEVRLVALDSLGDIADVSVVSFLAGELAKAPARVRQKLYEVISRFESSESTAALLSGLSQDDPIVVAICARALGERPAENCKNALTAAYQQQSDTNIKRHIAIALAKLGGPIKPELIDSLTSEHAWEAADALAEIDNEDARSALVAQCRLKTADASLRGRIAGILLRKSPTEKELLALLHALAQSRNRRAQGVAIEELRSVGTEETLKLLQRLRKGRRGEFHRDIIDETITEIEKRSMSNVV